MKKNLRIAINAQIPADSGSGGIETVLRVLTSLGELDGGEEYVFIGHWSGSEWLKPLLKGKQIIVSPPQPTEAKEQISEKLRRSLGPLRPLLRRVKQSFFPPTKSSNLPVSDGFYESLGCDVIHFPYQDYVRCQLPTIYNPHDLQHLHFPQFFSRDEFLRRERVYPAACRAAQTVVVASQFVKNDITQNYGIEAEKIQIIHWSPSESLFNRYNSDTLIPPIFAEPFVLYPAMTWEHKNHIRLLEAVALLRDHENLKINLICTGQQNSFFSQIEKRRRELRLEEQVKFTGLVTIEELYSFYRQAEFVIIPSLFEAASTPLFEAWQNQTAAACSNVTFLPEQAGNAALLFNPFSTVEIADALKKMAENPKLRETLCVNGTKRLQEFNFEKTLKTYRAVYRKTAGLFLNEEDRFLLENSRTEGKLEEI